MEQQKLPNVTLALVLSIISFLCCCFGGIGTAIISTIAFFIIRKDEQLYATNPDKYSNYSQLKTTKIIAIVGIVIGLFYFLYTLYSISQMGGWDGYMERVNEMMEQYQ